MFLPNLQSVTLPVPEIIAIAVLGSSWEPPVLGLPFPSLGEGETVGFGDGTVRKSVGEFLQALHGNVSSIFTRFRDFPLLCSSTPLFPTLPLLSPKFPHFPLGVAVSGSWPLGYEERRCIVRAISLQDFQLM